MTDEAIAAALRTHRSASAFLVLSEAQLGMLVRRIKPMPAGRFIWSSSLEWPWEWSCSSAKDKNLDLYLECHEAVQGGGMSFTVRGATRLLSALVTAYVCGCYPVPALRAMYC